MNDNDGRPTLPALLDMYFTMIYKSSKCLRADLDQVPCLFQLVELYFISYWLSRRKPPFGRA